MQRNRRDDAFRSSTPVFHQWQFEEAVNRLRRRVDEAILQRHWTTTGHHTIDATARAHIAEWYQLDVLGDSIECPASVLDALVGRALSSSRWNLFVVEDHGGDQMAVRRLRDGEGLRVRWLEGRSPPPVGSRIALRVAHLDPPGFDVATLPVVFGGQKDAAAAIPALLRAFGRSDTDCWGAFMQTMGARIVLEYGLSRLRRCAQAAPHGQTTGSDQKRRRLHQLEREFTRLERAVRRQHLQLPQVVELDEGRVAWLEDIAAGPHILMFDRRVHQQRYRRRCAQSGSALLPRPQVSCCRIRRVTPREISSAECAIGERAGLNPQADGMVQLQRTDLDGRLVDPRPEDFRAAHQACRRLAQKKPRRRDAA